MPVTSGSITSVVLIEERFDQFFFLQSAYPSSSIPAYPHLVFAYASLEIESLCLLQSCGVKSFHKRFCCVVTVHVMKDSRISASPPACAQSVLGPAPTAPFLVAGSESPHSRSTLNCKSEKRRRHPDHCNILDIAGLRTHYYLFAALFI